MSPPPGPADGPEPATVTAATSWSRSLLLGTADFPGDGWQEVEERSWPTGQLDPGTEKSQRALAAGGITVWRSLRRGESGPSAWVEVVPYASAEDADLSLPEVPVHFVGTVPRGGSVVSERALSDVAVPGVDRTWVYEKATVGPSGDELSRYVVGTVGRILFLTDFTGVGEAWPWAEVTRLASLQAERISASLGTGSAR